MASLNELHQRYLAVKLQFLEEQKGQLHSAVDGYVNMVINAGKQLTESEGPRLKYSEMFQGVERAVDFLFMKHGELSDITKVETLKFSQLLAGHLTTESELIGNVSPSSSAASTDHISAESSKCFLQTSRGKVPTRRTEQLSSQETENADVTQNIAPTKIVERLEKNEKQVKNIMDQLDQIKNQESQLQSLEKQLQKLSENQDTIQKLSQQVQNLSANQDKLQNLNKQMQKLSANQEKYQNLSKQVEKLSTNQDKLQNLNKEVQQLSANQDKLQNLVQEVKTNQDELPDEIIYRIHEDLEKKFTVMSNETQSLKDFMMSAFDKNDSSMEALSSRTESVEKATAELVYEISTKHDTLETTLRKMKINEVMLEELEKRLLLVETGETKHLKSVRTQLEEFDTNSKVLSQMLSTRLQPLEKLRNIFSEKSKARDENVTKLQEIMNEVAAMTPKIAELGKSHVLNYSIFRIVTETEKQQNVIMTEMKSPRPVVGFTAGIDQVQSCDINGAIALYTIVRCNKGDHFNPFSGIFTAPLHGVYVVSVTLCCENSLIHTGIPLGSTFQVKIILNDSSVLQTVCWGAAGSEWPRACDLGLVEMQIGDTLSAHVNKKYNYTQATKMRFSCFILS